MGEQPAPLGERAARVKAAGRLRRRAGRAKARRFLVEGPQAVREVLALASSGEAELFATPAAADAHADLVQGAAARGAQVHEVTEAALATLAETVHPQGLVAVSPQLDVDLTTVFARRPSLVVVLVHVRDPGNAGTVLRTADAAGADAVVFTEASVDPYNGKCVRSAAGSLFHLPVVAGVPAADVVAAARVAGLRTLAAESVAHRTLDDVAVTGQLGEPTAWLFGNEAWGLSGQVTAAVDEAVRVPIYGAAESLNLSVAAALCIYASAGAQRLPSGLVKHGDEHSVSSR